MLQLLMTLTNIVRLRRPLKEELYCLTMKAEIQMLLLKLLEISDIFWNRRRGLKLKVQSFRLHDKGNGQWNGFIIESQVLNEFHCKSVDILISKCEEL
jgi:hypothetical protein